MPIIPRWARAKVRTAKSRRKSTLNKRAKDVAPLATDLDIVAYRKRVRSYATIDSLTNAGDLITQQGHPAIETKWHGYPVEWVAFLSCFDKVPDDLLPPLVALSRKRKKEWQSAIKGQGKDRTHCLVVAEGSTRHIYCFIEGTRAYFVYLDKQRQQAYKSEVYTTMHAQFVIEQSHQGRISLEKVITWIETVSLPESSAS